MGEGPGESRSPDDGPECIYCGRPPHGDDRGESGQRDCPIYVASYQPEVRAPRAADVAARAAHPAGAGLLRDLTSSAVRLPFGVASLGAINMDWGRATAFEPPRPRYASGGSGAPVRRPARVRSSLLGVWRRSLRDWGPRRQVPDGTRYARHGRTAGASAGDGPERRSTAPGGADAAADVRGGLVRDLGAGRMRVTP